MKKHRLLSALLSATLGIACVVAPVPQETTGRVLSAIAATTTTPCASCFGTGSVRCSKCNGTGSIIYKENGLNKAKTCSNCNGRGKTSCILCGGKGYFTVKTDDDPSTTTPTTPTDPSINDPDTIEGVLTAEREKSIYGDYYYEITSCLKSAEKVVIPAYIDGIPVKSIGNYALHHCTNLTWITIPDSITSIGYSAFSGCTSLTEITIPHGVTSIASMAFSECTKLESIMILNPDCEIIDSENTISDTATIYGYENSTAQYYALEYNRKFIALNTELEISASAITLEEGEQYIITANQSDLTYKSNNTDVAVVSKKGIVTALGEGTAIISVVNADGDAAQLRVTVTAQAQQITTPPVVTITMTTSMSTATTTEPVTLPKLKLAASEITLEEGESYKITANQTGLIYGSGDKTVAVVSQEGVVTAVCKGFTAIAVGNSNDEVAYLYVTVISSEDYLKGDCNNDGNFNIADVIYLQKWILAEPDIKIANWKAADLCKDNKLDVFDFCLMKQALLLSYYGY